MSDIVEELKRGAEMEEEYDADGIIRIGYKRSLRYRAADEIERLRLENSQWQSACAGYTEALAARDRDNAALLEELARIRDQIVKHNISIKEAIRRGEAFEWKTLTLDS